MLVCKNNFWNTGLGLTGSDQTFQRIGEKHVSLQLNNNYYTHLTASFIGQPGYAGTKKAELFWILTKQEMMG